MAFKAYQVTVPAAAQSLLSLAVVGGVQGDANDVPYAHLTLQPAPGNSGDVYVGSDSTLTSAVAVGHVLTKPAANIPLNKLEIGPGPLGYVKLSQVFIVGTANDKVFVCGVPA